MKKASTAEKWLITGYNSFALSGLEGLKVELLAYEVGISKSSFYHHFPTTEQFLIGLLSLHISRLKDIVVLEQSLTCVNPDFIELVLEHRFDFLFHKQIRILKHSSPFDSAFTESDALLDDTFSKLWCKELGIEHKSFQMKALFDMAVEYFFVNLSPNSLSFSFLEALFIELNNRALLILK